MSTKAKTVFSQARSVVASQVAKNVIDSRRLFYFYHVARLGSFAAAESVLDIAQPAMSRQVQQLETELGAPLLVRNGRGVSLTEAGAIVYRRAEAILAGMEETHLEISAAMTQSGGRVSIAAPNFLIRSFMEDVIEQFSRIYPTAHLKVLEASTGHVAELLAAGEIDIGIVVHESSSPRIETELLVSENMDVVVAPDHPFAGKKRLSRDELKGEALCVASSRFGSRILVERYFDEAGMPMDVRMELDSMRLMISAIRTLRLISFIPSGDLKAEDGLVSIPLEPPIVRNLYLAKLRQHGNPLVEPLSEQIRSALGRAGGSGKPPKGKSSAKAV